MALFWNGGGWTDKNVDGGFDIIWFIGTPFELFEPIWPKPLRTLLFKFKGEMLDNDAIDGLFDANCDGKLGDGVIDVFFEFDDDETLEWINQNNIRNIQFNVIVCWSVVSNLDCGAGFAVTIAGILIEDGIKTSLTFFVSCAVVLSLFKQDDVKASKLNSGNDCVEDSSIDLRK